MPTLRIFVSHSHQDSPFGLQLVADLRARLGEAAVWYDESGGLHGGDEWWKKIVAEITDRDTFIVILSPAALASDWVPREMGIAYWQHVKLGKRLFPVLLHPCAPTTDWEMIQATNFTGYPTAYETQLAQLLADLGVTASVPASVPAPIVDHRSLNVQRWTQEALAALGEKDWSLVLDKTDLIPEGELTVPLWRARGLAQLTLGQPDLALATLQRAEKLDAHDVTTLRVLAQAFTTLGRDADAERVLTRAQAIPPPTDAAARLPLLGDLCDVLTKEQKWDDLQRRIADALRLAPNDPAWRQRQLTLQLRPLAERFSAQSNAGKWTDALATSEEALHLASTDATWQQRRVQAQTEIQRAQQAIAEQARQAEMERQRQAAAEEQARLAKLLPASLQKLNFTVKRFGTTDLIIPPVSALIPAGPFTLGGDKEAYNGGSTGTPAVSLNLGAFQIGLYPMTVAEYACAVAAKAVAVPQDASNLTWAQQQQHPDHPVVCVTWLQARDYTRWLADKTGQPWRLPTEAEWERAARGTDGRIFPWGNTFDKTKANTSDGGKGTTTPVGYYAEKGDTSPCGVHDMAGNVWEWTSSIWQERYDSIKCDDNSDETSVRVLRGGSWGIAPQYARAVSRGRDRPSYWSINWGWRLAVGAGGAGS